MKSLHLAFALALGAGLPLNVASGPVLAATADAPSAARRATAAKPAAPARPAASPKVSPEAIQALRRMSAYLQKLPTFELQSETSLDLVTQEGQRLQLDGRATYKVRRPNGFVISVNTDVKKRTFYYDGKKFTVSAPELGYYASAAAPPTIKGTLDVLWNKFAIALPLEDLFRWSDPAGARVDTVKEAFAVGPATISGVATDHYAFREGDIDWQVWIQKGDRPLPRKLVIVDRTDPANPAYVAKLTWNTAPKLTAADFNFVPAKNAKAIKIASVR